MDPLSFVASLVTSALIAMALVWPSPPEAKAPPIPEPTPIDADFDSRHAGDPLCFHHDVWPVAAFHHDYSDSQGNHYHGFIPPVGPPFYVQCYSVYGTVQ